MQAHLKSSLFEHFPSMNRLLREQLVGRTVVDLSVEKDRTFISLDNGGVLEVPGLCFEFHSPHAH